MSRTIGSPRHKALANFLIEQRKKAGLTQEAVAKRLRRYQSYVASVELGQKKLDVVELLDFARAIGFDARQAISRLLKTKTE